jgi:hypothetical protein
MTMPRSGRLICASLLAPTVPVILYIGFNRDIGIHLALYALAISYLHAAIAIPTLLWLSRFGALRLRVVLVTSALVAATPISLLTLSLDLPAFESVNDVVMVEAGRLTLSGCWDIIWQALEAGLLGTSAGVVWHRLVGRETAVGVRRK